MILAYQSWCGKIQNQRLEVLRNTFNLHSNSNCVQEVRSLNQFICICSKKNKRVAYTHIHTILFSLIKFCMFFSLNISDYLIGLAF